MKKQASIEHARNTDGFTIVEMMVACVICLVLMVAASTHFITVAQSLENADRFTSQAIQQQNGSYFKELFTRASPTYHFLKLPISVGCGSYKLPCLRRYDSDSRRFVPNESVASDPELNSYISTRLDSSKGVQFFRDGTGSLSFKTSSNIAAPTASGVKATNKPQVQIPVPINTAAAIGDTHSNAIYTTWPLRDTSSQPFPVITQKSNYVLFTHVATLAASKPVSHHMAFFTSRAQRAFFPGLENSLVSIYTLNDPSEYAIQFMKKIVDCVDATYTAQCLAWAKELNDSIDYVPAGKSSSAFTDLVGKGLVAIELYDPFQAPGTTISEELQKSLPDLTAFNNSIASVRWKNSVSSNFFAFPSDLWSLSDTASSVVIDDLKAPCDIRRIQHYYTGLGSQVQFVLLPVDIATYWLEENKSDPTQLNLVTQYIRDASNSLGNQKRTMIDDVIPNPNNLISGTVPQVLYFSRRLGTPTIDVVIEQTGVMK